jgi:hypothetical protein
LSPLNFGRYSHYILWTAELGVHPQILTGKETKAVLLNNLTHGLRISLKFQIFGIGQTNWADKFWGIFIQSISIIFGTVSPLSMFSNVQSLYLQK